MKILAAIGVALAFYLGCYALGQRYGALWLAAAVIAVTAVLGFVGG